jgi:SAM-dependent methyltransferase
MPEIGWTEKLANQWSEYRPPSRPSSSEVDIFESYIKTMPKNSSILLLGSTPEIRDLAAKYGMKITICDWSEEIFKALKLLTKDENYKEGFSKQDWREMKFTEKFDMVIGDCAITVVAYGDVGKVLENIREAVKENGLVIQRIWARNKRQDYSLDDIARIFREKPENVHWYTQMLFPVFLHYYDTENESLSGEEIYQKMQEDYEKGKISGELLELFSLVKNHKTPNNVLLKEELEKLLGKYFKITKVEYGKDDFKENSPIYIMKSK